MYEVYVLVSQKSHPTYVGYAKTARVRLADHNRGKVKATRHDRPWYILFTEKSDTLAKAKKRERYWKSGAGRRKLIKFFKEGFPPRS